MTDRNKIVLKDTLYFSKAPNELFIKISLKSTIKKKNKELSITKKWPVCIFCLINLQPKNIFIHKHIAGT